MTNPYYFRCKQNFGLWFLIHTCELCSTDSTCCTQTPHPGTKCWGRGRNGITKGTNFLECCVHNTTEVVTVNQCKSAINLFMTNWSVTSFDFVNIKLYLFTLTSPTILFFTIFDLGLDKKYIIEKHMTFFFPVLRKAGLLFVPS